MLKDLEIIKKYVDNIEKYSSIIEKNRLDKSASKAKAVAKIPAAVLKAIQAAAKTTGKGGVHVGTALQHPTIGPALLAVGVGGVAFEPRIKRKVKEKIYKARHGGYYSY